MLNDKNKILLGKMVIGHFASVDNSELSYLAVGEAIEKKYNYVCAENERDERDLANGKGKS